MIGSGDGWVGCRLGHRHWGRYGAAGLLLRTSLPVDGDVLLQLRADWSHHGGTWGLPGGARDQDETAVQAAVREATEEVGLAPTSVRAEAAYVDDHGGWSYTTVVATTRAEVHPRPSSPETAGVRWVGPDQVSELPLHPGFAATWPRVRAIGAAPILVVDAANTIGSRPDGWWRDRAGAVRRLRDAFATALADGLVLGSDPTYPDVVVVTEGAARGVEPIEGVEVLAAPGSGDDTIVEVVAQRAGPRSLVVVTADRELRNRVLALGATTLGPRTLLDQLD